MAAQSNVNQAAVSPSLPPSVNVNAASSSLNPPLIPTPQPRKHQVKMSLEEIRFRYEPFPIAFAPNFFDPGYYRLLLKHWPSNELFEYASTYGNKYSLSEGHHREQYHQFIKSSPTWGQFHDVVKSRAFIKFVIETLRFKNVDIGYTPDQLTARFEFSMLSADGGYVTPHTDAPQKIITMVIFMVHEGEWPAEYGGGTSVLKPVDVAKNYNHININVGFDEVKSLETYPYQANSCVVFVKTFNSYHAVYPIQGPPHVMRRSLTINIEDAHHPSVPYIKLHPHRRGKFGAQ